ncbi:probable undecaprenyl-phosphate N-acetylglucosaminyl 1-phosphate transferase [Acidimicrobiaceae bacterium]|nr:probable undecaprenyl-phosphate N-acetylglucosaminyl 1-phosphate transferase [Acidimicrobiaceae bacterium]
MIFLIVIATITISFGLTHLVRKIAITRNKFDIPNERSSHKNPTPRGGGVAVVAAFVFGLLALLIRRDIDAESFYAIVLPGALVAIIGYLDDLGRVTAARLRLIGHFVAALIAIYILGGLPPMPLFSATLDIGLVGNIIAVLFLVWMLNLFNFMDGIDSITGIEALTSCLILTIFLINKSDTELWRVPALLCAAVIGFLYFNWPPAKIFLGDIGSGFIGFTIGTISLVIAKSQPLITWAVIILLGVFIVDATVTLIRRVYDKQQISAAHRSHAFQHLANNADRHLKVSLSIAAVNIFWLAPIAWLVVDQQLQPIVGVSIAYVPLVVLAIYFKAGKTAS